MSNPSSINPFHVVRLNTSQDYRPEWDVPSINGKVSDWLEEAIQGLRGRTQADPGLVIPVLLAPPGYGKTHLFGRIAHRLGHEALFVFIPQVEDIRRPLEHIRWHAVESLFQARSGEHPLLGTVLARLCQQSFLGYFDRLPPSLAAQHQQLRGKLQEDPMTALEIVSRVNEVAPFEKLADSVAKGFPELQGDIVRALLLGWSPEAATVRRWLRGESLPENDLERLHLGEEPPDAAKVLRAIAVLLKFQMPIVLCCDQLETVLVEIEEGPIRVSNALIGLLQSIPNQLVVMSCLEDKWPAFMEHAHASFTRRVRPFKLEPLNEVQAAELVRRRLSAWPGAWPEKGAWWPFKEESVRTFARKQQVPPHGLIQVCAAAYDHWVDAGMEGWIEIGPSPNGDTDLSALFLQEWNKELEQIQNSPNRTPDTLQEERLFRGVKEALDLARDAKLEIEGTRVVSLQEGVLPPAGNEKRPSLKLLLAEGSQQHSVVLALTKLDNGKLFQYYFTALARALADPVAGAVLVHPKSDVRMGAATATAFENTRKQGKLRTFPLVEHGETFTRLECLLGLLDKARSKELRLGQLTVSDKDCLDLAIKTDVMANLDLFHVVCANWHATATTGATGGSKAAAGATAKAAGTGAGTSAGQTSTGGAQTGTATAEKTKTSQTVDSKVPGGDSSATGTAAPENPETWASKRLDRLVEKLKLWSLPVEPDGMEIGPTFVRLRVKPLGKTSVNRVRNKAEDLKIHLNLKDCPLIAAQAGYISVDVELPQRQTVALDHVLAQPPAGKAGDPFFPLGQDVAGKTHWLNLADPADCHLLVAGTTGSGKSEFLKSILASLARRHTYQQLQFVLIDPKQVTFNFSRESPYFLHPVANTVEEAVPLIQGCFAETEKRYALLKKRHLENVSQLQGSEALPRIVVVVDELFDLMADTESKKALEKPLKKIGALARAAGIHLVLATQRPEASVVTPLLRSNLPGRISLKVASEADSKLILGVPDASHLLGRGDLLWKYGGGFLRLQSPLVSREELEHDLRLL